MGETDAIRTPDQRLRVFVSSTLEELGAERQAARSAVMRLHLVPVMFELGARPYPPQQVYRSYLARSQVFVGVYWQSYGWVAPGQQLSGLEDEYLLAAGMPRLIYVKSPAPERDPALAGLLSRIRDDGGVSYQTFTDPAELQGLVENDLAVLLSERFELGQPGPAAAEQQTPLAGLLPAPATPLVGRDSEIDALAALVLDGGVRLVTFTGPGGVGKSRLAVALARRLEPDFLNGVRFADLARLPAADLVPGAIAGALGLTASGTGVISSVESYLRTRRLLLVLDNFEQLVGAAPVIADLLGTAPELVVLVTSRAVLRLNGEHEFSVPTLPVPELGAGSRVADVAAYAAVQLFTGRARAASESFELTSENAPAVAEICRRLDGLPLAIELAAARVRLLPPQALLARLSDPMRLLTGGARDLPERQRTLRSTLDWSFGLLPPSHQAAFAKLGVFAGSFDLPAAEAVCGQPAPAEPVIDTLSSLVDNSLVRPHYEGAEPRFGLLETIREYALERLKDSPDDWQQAHDRHGAYFLAVTQPSEAELEDPGQLRWLRRLETEHDNFVAALSWSVDHDDFRPALDALWASWRFWWFLGHAEEMAHFTEALVAKAQAMTPPERMLALSGAAFDRLATGNQAGGLALLTESLPLLRRSSDRMRTGLILAILGHITGNQGHDDDAIGLLEEGQAQLDQASVSDFTGPDRTLYLLALAEVPSFLGQIKLRQGDYDTAQQLFQDGLDRSCRTPDRFTILISLYDLGVSIRARGDLARAETYLREGLSLAAEMGDETTAVYFIEELAAVAARGEDARRAVRLLAAAGALFEATGSGWLHVWVSRPPHDPDQLETLWSRLGDEAFQDAWLWGSSVSGRRAVEYALGHGDPD